MALYMLSEDPSTFTATAGETITQGDLLKATGSTVMTVTTDPSTADLLQVYACNASGDEDSCVGVAMNSAVDGDMITVRTSGIFIFQVEADNGTITVGADVQASGGSVAYEVELLDITDGARCIGQALTPATTDDEFVMVLLNTQCGAAQA